MKLGIEKLTNWFRDHRGVAILLFVLFLLWAGLLTYRTAHAEEDWSLAVGLGAGVTNDNGWIAQELELRYGRWHIAALRTGDDDALPDTWRLSAAWGYEWRAGKFVRPCIRFGAAWWADDITPLISDSLSYHMVACLQVGPNLQFDWQHNSTAGRAEFNDGNDMVLLKYVAPLPF